MSLSVLIASLSWIAFLIFLFVRFPARRAVLVGFLAGWMFLPVVTYPISGWPDYTKTFALSVGMLLAVALFDLRALLAVRPVWADVPILLFCVSPFLTSIHAGLGVHDGLSAVFAQGITWAVPYLLGVLYCKSLAGMRDLAMGIFAGGLIYVPFCIFEMVASPRLHLWIYGSTLGDLSLSAMRFGGWRPTVFMTSGLMLAVWMAAASLLGIWLCATGVLHSAGRFRWMWLAAFLALTTVAIRSVNAWLLVILGTFLLAAASRWGTAIPVYSTIALVLGYVLVSATGIWSGEAVVPVVSAIINPERAESLHFRFLNEKVISENAREHAVLGWGRTSAVLVDRYRVVFPFADTGTSYATVDSMWMGIFAAFGAVGLVGLFGSLLLPVLLFLMRFPAAEWRQVQVAPAAGLAIVLLMYAIDNLANGFVDPAFMLIAGGLARCVPELCARTEGVTRGPL